MDQQRIINEFPEYLGSLRSATRFECDDGWNELIYNLCTDLRLNGVKPFFGFVIIKEKYGTLRVQLSDGTSEVGWNLIEKYEKLSETTCEYCGKTGAKTRNERHWVKTLCDICNKGS